MVRIHNTIINPTVITIITIITTLIIINSKCNTRKIKHILTSFANQQRLSLKKAFVKRGRAIRERERERRGEKGSYVWPISKKKFPKPYDRSVNAKKANNRNMKKGREPEAAMNIDFSTMTGDAYTCLLYTSRCV